LGADRSQRTGAQAARTGLPKSTATADAEPPKHKRQYPNNTDEQRQTLGDATLPAKRDRTVLPAGPKDQSNSADDAQTYQHASDLQDADSEQVQDAGTTAQAQRANIVRDEHDDQTAMAADEYNDDEHTADMDDDEQHVGDGTVLPSVSDTMLISREYNDNEAEQQAESENDDDDAPSTAAASYYHTQLDFYKHVCCATVGLFLLHFNAGHECRST
jgi:hypothetical protein